MPFYWTFLPFFWLYRTHAPIFYNKPWSGIHAFLSDIGGQRILQFDWTRAFCSITCKAKLSHTWDLHRETENCKVLHFKLLPPKSWMTELMMTKSKDRIDETSRKLNFAPTSSPFCPFYDKQIIFWKTDFCHFFWF